MNCELMLTYITPSSMFNVYKNQLSQQTGSRNLTGPKTLPTISQWHTYVKLVTKYQIFAINSCWEKCDGRTDESPSKGRTEVNSKPPPTLLWWSGGITMYTNEQIQLNSVLRHKTNKTLFGPIHFSVFI